MYSLVSGPSHSIETHITHNSTPPLFYSLNIVKRNVIQGSFSFDVQPGNKALSDDMFQGGGIFFFVSTLHSLNTIKQVSFKLLYHLVYNLSNSPNQLICLRGIMFHLHQIRLEAVVWDVFLITRQEILKIITSSLADQLAWE